MIDKDRINDISSIREEYALQTLSETDVVVNAMDQFEKWFNEALNAKVREPNAMALGTVSSSNRPSVRIVLLKGIKEGKFRFFTNYQSKKGTEISKNPNVCLTFFWPELERQVRVEGIATKVSTKESEEYFHSRPIGSQIGAIASPQSQVIKGREIIENTEKELKRDYQNSVIPKPDHWGGFEISPELIEFWQGRKSRLHDRIQYTLIDNNWKIERLAP